MKKAIKNLKLKITDINGEVSYLEGFTRKEAEYFKTHMRSYPKVKKVSITK